MALTRHIRRYSDLAQIDSFEDRFEYLALKGQVGQLTFGHERWMNQRFYTSKEWRDIRHYVIARDNGCDLGAEGYEIFDRIIIHHMNPLSSKDLQDDLSYALNPDFLITTTHNTHNAIHYGDKSLLPSLGADRRPGDTRLW